MPDKNLIFKDKSGKILAPGDLIVYGHALGRCASLKYGKVVAIEWSAESYDGDKKPKLKIRGLDDDGSQWSHWDINSAKISNRKSVLEFPSRVLKIERDQLPNEYVKLFDSVQVEVESKVIEKTNRLKDVE